MHQNDNSQIKQSINEHLTELRNRLLKIILLIIIIFLLLTPFAKQIYYFVATPLLKSLPIGNNIIITNPIDAIFIPLKINFVICLLVTLPNTIYQLWCFIAPALYKNEKKIIITLVISTLILFILGMTFCYYIFLPILFNLMVKLTPTGAIMMPSIDNYIPFVINMFLTFGITFEVPIIIILLQQLNIINLNTLKNIRPYIIVLNFIIAAIITPPDIISQFLLAIPLTMLYEIGIIICKILNILQKNKSNEK